MEQPADIPSARAPEPHVPHRELNSAEQARSLSEEQPQPEASTLRQPPAQYHQLPKMSFSSIEFPGPVSEPMAILDYSSQDAINACFNAPVGARPNLEVRFRGDQSGPPIRGHRGQSQKLLLKVVKRKKKTGQSKPDDSEEGVFTAKVEGTIGYTVRFVSMADYQWAPNPEGHTASIIDSLKALDYNAILDYSFPPLDEEFVVPNPDTSDPDIKYLSKLDLQPPPIFSTRQLPPVYNFKMPSQLTPEHAPHPITGRMRTRYVNKARTTGMGPQTVQHDHTPGDVPHEPTPSIKEKMARLKPEVLQKLKDTFQRRPIWTKHSLYEQFSPEEVQEIKRNKAYIPSVAYVVTTGVFWNCHIKFGYDPITHLESRMYQRIFFYPQKKTVRNPVNTRPEDEEEGERAKGWWGDEQQRLVAQGLRPPIDRKKLYVFDGQYLHRERGDFQLCDVIDPFIVPFINDTENLSKTCTLKSGWYTPSWATLIKSLVRVKYMHMWETGTPASDDICIPILEDYEKGKLGDDDGDEIREDMGVYEPLEGSEDEEDERGARLLGGLNPREGVQVARDGEVVGDEDDEDDEDDGDDGDGVQDDDEDDDEDDEENDDDDAEDIEELEDD